MSVVAFVIFACTLAAVITKPRNLSIGWSAMGGAVVAILARVVSFQDVWDVTSIVWNATFSLVGIILISLLLDQIGFFEWAALHMAHIAKGNGRLMFVYVILLGAVVSAFFTNDGAALILTPIVLAQVRALKLDERMVLAYVMASGFIADTSSLPFIISNLVNILSADYFDIGFAEYSLHMLLPNLFSIAASIVVLLLFFRKSIPASYDTSRLAQPREAIKDMPLFRLSWGILGVLLLSLFCSGWMHVPVSLIINAVALFFLLMARRSKSVQTWSLIKDAPWVVIVFSIGMYVVVWGLGGVGLTDLLARWIRTLADQGVVAAALGMGFLAAFLSSVMNNLPTVMFDALAIKAAHTTGIVQDALIYANVIGSDLGPKITPIGSLATLLWLHVLQRKGVKIGWGTYFKTGIVLTLPTLLFTLAGLIVALLIKGS
ncbi:arsenic transporter [Brevibacillus fluminis]|uniref:arsenic transporter n=1 Tax=Brevibacillus fluminis TaxID=511487 RepID=UPI003F8BDED6